MTGRAAFQDMYAVARLWQPDAAPLLLESGSLTGTLTLQGKAPMWRATFVSAASHKQRDFQYVSIHVPDGPERGMSRGQETAYHPAGPDTVPFSLSYLKSDSDQAFQVAENNGGTRFRKREPDSNVFYTLREELVGAFPHLTWDLAYGRSRATAPFVVRVDAASGQLLTASKPSETRP
ncbi:MAG: hypothetical protein ACYC6M_11165 [Terriglobales bacterium]